MGVQSEKALRLLESPASYPGLVERSEAHVPLRIWQYPSFRFYSSWAIVKESKHLYLRRITWDQSDTLRVEPMTYGSEVSMEPDRLEPLLARLKSIQLPPFISAPSIGLDGTRYGVEVDSFFLSARLSWWESTPPEWAALHAWHAQAVATFEALLPVSTPSVLRS